MHRSVIERRLFEVSAALRQSRDELAVVDEQLTALSEAVDEARVKALVSETPVAQRELQEARRHAQAMARGRADLVARMANLERTQDDLLGKIVL